MTSLTESLPSLDGRCGRSAYGPYRFPGDVRLTFELGLDPLSHTGWDFSDARRRPACIVSRVSAKWDCAALPAASVSPWTM